MNQSVSADRKYVSAALLLTLAITCFCLAFLAEPAYSQFYFGKNKVQYTDFDWQVMETENFRIFFYPEEEELAKIAARISEDSYRELASRFKLEI